MAPASGGLAHQHAGVAGCGQFRAVFRSLPRRDQPHAGVGADRVGDRLSGRGHHLSRGLQCARAEHCGDAVVCRCHRHAGRGGRTCAGRIRHRRGGVCQSGAAPAGPRAEPPADTDHRTDALLRGRNHLQGRAGSASARADVAGIYRERAASDRAGIGKHRGYRPGRGDRRSQCRYHLGFRAGTDCGAVEPGTRCHRRALDDPRNWIFLARRFPNSARFGP